MVPTPFKALSEHEFISITRGYTPILTAQGQGDVNIFRRYRPGQSRGSGIWSILSQFGKRALPLLKKYVLPSAMEFGKNVASDVIEGRSIKESLRNRGKSSLKNIGKTILKGGKKRKRSRSHVKGRGSRVSKMRRVTRRRKNNSKNGRKKSRKQIGCGCLGKKTYRKNVTSLKKKRKRKLRSKSTIVRSSACSRKKNSSCPKDIFTY